MIDNHAQSLSNIMRLVSEEQDKVVVDSAAFSDWQDQDVKSGQKLILSPLKVGETIIIRRPTRFVVKP